MRIVIVGAGAIGSYLARRLSGEGQDVILIEGDERHAAEMQGSLDALVVTGNGASPSVLREAGASGADMLIAVSNSDGANILACHNAHDLGVQRTIARIEDPSLREGVGELGVDVVIDPGDIAARELLRLVNRAGLSEIDVFGEGHIALVGGVVEPGSMLAGGRLSDLRGHPHAGDWLVVAVIQRGETIVARGDTTIGVGDRIFLMVPSAAIEEVNRALAMGSRELGRGIVVGTTRLATLAVEQLLGSGREVVVIDHERARCQYMAEHYGDALVVCGDPADPAVYDEQGLSRDDALLALTGWDEVNVMSCLVGRALGAGMTVARFHRLDHVTLLDGVGIDATVSSRLSAADEILKYVRGEHVHVVASIKHSEAEAFEVEVTESSPALGRTLAEVDLREDAIIGGVLRNGDAFVPTGTTRVQADDHLIVFAMPDAIEPTRRLFAR